MLRILLAALLGTWLAYGCAPRETVPTSLAAATSRVEGGLRIETPEGPGPFPTVLYFHSASDKAWHAEQARILDRFVAAGFAAVFVDMYYGRGLGGHAVRSGALMPRAAAGDVMIAVDWAGRQPWVAHGKLGLFGISFGAATIMDALVLDRPGGMPTSLEEKPAGGLSAVAAAALLSPWCAGDIIGFDMLMAVDEDFARQVPMLAILPQADTVSDVALCAAILERNKAAGTMIEVVSVSGASHVFAQARDDYGNPFPGYDAEKAVDAWRRIVEFFKARLG